MKIFVEDNSFVLKSGFIFLNRHLTSEVVGKVDKLLSCVTNFDCLRVE